MSEEQLTALLAKLKEDTGLREKLQGVADLDAVVALAKEAGFDVSKTELDSNKASKQILDMTADDLTNIRAGTGEYYGERSNLRVNSQITDSVTQ
jgi:predicted ribosomally synthesized peptide with nif11-like leader